MSTNSIIVPVVMSGGAGTRLWPLSVQEKPKQLHALTGTRTLLQETVLRCPQTRGFAPPVLVCAARHAAQVEAQCAAVNTMPTAIITEPCPRNTAPCAVTAALAVREQYGDDAQVLLLAADHFVADTDCFVEAIKAGGTAAANGHIVTFGAGPTSPATGYGYIRRGDAVDDAAFAVSAFVEKPDLKTAKSYVNGGDYVWNAGIFLFQAGVMLDEVGRYREDILKAATQAWAGAERSGLCVHLDEAAFSDCPSESVDYAVMEHTQKAAMVPLNAGWSDVGAWPAIYDLAAKDTDDNVLHGRVVALDSHGCLLHADTDAGGPMIAALGVDNLAIVSTGNAVLIVPVDRADNIKALIAKLDDGDL